MLKWLGNLLIRVGRALTRTTELVVTLTPEGADRLVELCVRTDAGDLPSVLTNALMYYDQVMNMRDCGYHPAFANPETHSLILVYDDDDDDENPVGSPNTDWN